MYTVCVHAISVNTPGSILIVGGKFSWRYVSLQSEDKKVKPLGSLQGALIVLEHVVKQEYFPKLAKDILCCFLAL